MLEFNLENLLAAKIAELGTSKACLHLGSPPTVIAKWRQHTGLSTVHACQKVLDEALRKHEASQVAAASTARPHGPAVVPPQGRPVAFVTPVPESVEPPVPQTSTGVPAPVARPIITAAVPASDRPLIAGGKKIHICLPIRKHIEVPTHVCTIGLFQRIGNQLITDFIIGSQTWVARNDLANKIMKDKESDWSIWFDDDMIFPNGNFQTLAYFGSKLPNEWGGINVVERLLTRGQKLVSALYVQRQEHGRAQFKEAFAGDQANTDAHVNVPRNETKPVGWFGAGCFAVHRTVFEAIASKFPDLHDERGQIGFFTPTHGLGEDIEFCNRAKECGIQPYVDMGCLVGHRGFKDYWPHNSL